MKKIYKAIRSSGYLQIEECEHEHKTPQEAKLCVAEKNRTGKYKNWIVKQ